MRKARTKLFLPLAAIWALALPAAASAEYLVPPGNSAATQYTETVPTAGGQRNTEKDRRRGGDSPAEILGAGNARRLDEQGEAGREVAQFAAETAPSPANKKAPTGDDEGNRGDDDGGRKDDQGGAATGAGPDGTGGGGSAVAEPSGSSGFGEVLAQATGWSSSEGLLLLAILGALAWALAFLWRQRDRSTA
jgi:hypothetical protein